MTTEPVRIYWDNCAFISFIQGPGSACPEDAVRAPILDKIYNLAKDKSIVFVISPLIIAEVTRLKGRPELDLNAQATKITNFFKNDFFMPWQLDRRIAEDAAEIGRKFGIKPGDAVHVATAIRAKCESLHTYDGEDGNQRKLLAFDGKIGTPPLKIRLPYLPTLKPDPKTPLFKAT